MEVVRFAGGSEWTAFGQWSVIDLFLIRKHDTGVVVRTTVTQFCESKTQVGKVIQSEGLE